MSSIVRNEVEEDETESAFQITEAVNTQRIINIYLNDTLDSPHMYVAVLDKFRTASPQDLFYVYLNTPGGYVDTGVQLINAMKDTKARVITVLDGTVCSMGALLFLAADEFIVHDNCRLMFHNYSGGTYGKGHEQIAQLASSVEWYTTMVTEICFPFLDEDEIDSVISGQDLWLSSDEVRERLEVVVAYAEEVQRLLDEDTEKEQQNARKKELLTELKKIEAKELRAEKKRLKQEEKEREREQKKAKTEEPN